jgi:hypothetical protein
VLDSSTPATVAPTITREPADLQAPYNSNVAFSVQATGTPAPTFSWLRDGVAIPGANSAFLTLTNVTTSGRYSVVVSNSAGSTTSRTAMLTVAAAPPVATVPVFTTQPTDMSASGASTVTFVATASGTPAPTYQWRKNGADISGATNSSLTLSSVSLADAAKYAVLASNSAGSTLSTEASLMVSTVPVFTTQPISQAVLSGASVTFSVAATGSPAPSFQWRKNGSSLSGATSSLLRLDNVTKVEEGTYDVLAWNSAGNSVSTGASLVVQTPYVPPPAPPPPATTTEPLPGVILRANYTLTLDPYSKRVVSFLIRGDVPKTILVRAVGPTLANLGTSGALADPQLYLTSTTAAVGMNDNWGGTPELMKAFGQAGATPFVSTDSKDAALVATVAPGMYNVVVTSADGAGGTVLVEVYEFP